MLSCYTILNQVMINTNHEIIVTDLNNEVIYPTNKHSVFEDLVKNNYKGLIHFAASDSYYNIISNQFTDNGATYNFHFIQDVTNEKRREIEWRSLSLYDELTGIFNRNGFKYAEEKLILEAKENEQLIAFVICDIDHFKQINDTNGHSAGDEVLKNISEILKESSPRRSIVSRAGGEEFIIMFPVLSNKEAIDKTEAIRCAIEGKVHVVENKFIKVTMSFGVQVFDPLLKYDIHEITKEADNALYYGKGNGRNQVNLFSSIKPHLKNSCDSNFAKRSMTEDNKEIKEVPNEDLIRMRMEIFNQNEA